MDAPHEVLGVDPDADEATIEAAYRERVKETHPDQGGSVGAFLVVRSAYDQLSTNGADGADLENPDGSDTEAATDEKEDATATTVEYLNFDVLADFGWTLEDPDLFDKAAETGLEPPDFGRFAVDSGDASLLEAAEHIGYDWPFACRGGACANCAVAVHDGDLSTPVNHILPETMLDRGIRLSCVGAPESDHLQVVYNVKHLPELDDLRLPPRPFETSKASD
ncbi:MAG: ferredoxin Fer [Salinirussus sp.]